MVNPFIKFQIGIIILFLIVAITSIVITCISDKKKNQIDYIVTDKYLVKKGTPLYFRSFRQIKIFVTVGRRTFSSQRAINLYLTKDGLFLETDTRSAFNKELDLLDKDVFVLKLQDNNNNNRLISYMIESLPEFSAEILKKVEIGDKVKLKTLTTELTEVKTPQTVVLVNKQLIL